MSYATGPVKVVFCLNRRPDLSTVQFERHWREVHAPLVRRAIPLFHAVRYVQNRRIESVAGESLRRPRGAPPAFDGVAEIWWENIVAFNQSLSTPEARTASKELLSDEANFIDLGTSPIWLAYEDEIVSLSRRAGASRSLVSDETR